MHYRIDLNQLSPQTDSVIVSKSTPDGREMAVLYHCEDGGVAFIKYEGVMVMFDATLITAMIMFLQARKDDALYHRGHFRGQNGRAVLFETIDNADPAKAMWVITEFGSAPDSINDVMHLRRHPHNDVDTLYDILTHLQPHCQLIQYGQCDQIIIPSVAS